MDIFLINEILNILSFFLCFYDLYWRYGNGNKKIKELLFLVISVK